MQGHMICGAVENVKKKPSFRDMSQIFPSLVYHEYDHSGPLHNREATLDLLRMR